MMTVSGTRAEPMDPVDVAWLHMDRPANLMVVNTVLWFDAPVDQASVLEMFGERVVSRFRRFRQRVADPALTLAPWAAPEWVDDAGFALADHVSRTRLPAPGDQRALQRAASDLAGRPLRKDRPLWELHLFDGYGDGGALLLRTHHAIADGGALMQVLLSLADPLDAGEHTGVLPVHDDTPGPPLLPGPGGRTAGRAMAAARRAGSAAGDLSAVLGAALADPRKAAGLAGSARADTAMLRKLGFGLTAGRNLLQGPLVPGKQRAWTRPVPLEAVRAAAAATGSTVNDLMLTAITSALRRYLLEHHALAEEVIVIVPVNLRPAGVPLPAGLGNQFGLAFVRLPTGRPTRAVAAPASKRRWTRSRTAAKAPSSTPCSSGWASSPRPCRTPGSTRSPARPPLSSPTSAARPTGYRSPGHRSRAWRAGYPSPARWALGSASSATPASCWSAWPVTRTCCPATTGSWPC